MARTKSNGNKDPTANLGFEAAALRGSASFNSKGTLRSLKGNRWLAAAVAGEKLPDGAAPDSFNLLPTLLGQPKQMKRDTLVVMSGNGDLAIRQGQWKYRANLALADGWQSGPKKPNQPAQPALFDLSTDQGETKNLAQQTALRDSALLQSGASSQVVSEAKDKPAMARRMAELLEKAQSAKSTRPSSP